MQPGLYVTRQFDRLRIAEDIHREPGLIDYHLAVPAVLKMALKFLPQRQIELAVNVVRNFVNDASAIQFVPPCRK